MNNTVTFSILPSQFDAYGVDEEFLSFYGFTQNQDTGAWEFTGEDSDGNGIPDEIQELFPSIIINSSTGQISY